MEPITMLYLGSALANLVNGKLSREATAELEDKRQEFQASLEKQRQEFQREQDERFLQPSITGKHCHRLSPSLSSFGK
jgi:hypothetical protein